jgi:hypothetical protein
MDVSNHVPWVETHQRRWYCDLQISSHIGCLKLATSMGHRILNGIAHMKIS